MKKQVGGLLILVVMASAFIGGCGAKSPATAAVPVEPTANAQQNNTGQAATNTGKPSDTQQSADVAAERANLQKVNITSTQGQAVVDQGIDQKMQSLDSALNKLDNSMGNNK